MDFCYMTQLLVGPGFKIFVTLTENYCQLPGIRDGYKFPGDYSVDERREQQGKEEFPYLRYAGKKSILKSNILLRNPLLLSYIG